MTIPNTTTDQKPYRLEDRTKKFAIDIRDFLKKIPGNYGSIEDCKQLLRSSGSIGANYLEAHESLSRKDCLHRLKISRKEARESAYWLSIFISHTSPATESLRKELENEAVQLTRILSSILIKALKKEW